MTCLTFSAGVRRAPISMVSGLCIAHWMSVSICGGMVAENSALCVCADIFRRGAATSGKNPMSSIRSASSSTRNSTLSSFNVPCCRCRAAVRAWRRRCLCRFSIHRSFAITDAAEDHGGFQVGEARVITEAGFHLRGEFARGFEDERRGPTALWTPSLKGSAGQTPPSCRCSLRAADDIAAGQHRARVRLANWMWVSGRCNRRRERLRGLSQPDPARRNLTRRLLPPRAVYPTVPGVFDQRLGRCFKGKRKFQQGQKFPRPAQPALPSAAQFQRSRQPSPAAAGFSAGLSFLLHGLARLFAVSMRPLGEFQNVA